MAEPADAPRPLFKENNLRRMAAAAVSGLALAITFPPFRGEWLAWIAFAWFLNIILGARRLPAFFCGFLHGVVFNAVTVPWVYAVMREHGGLSVVAASGVYAVMVLYLSIYPALFALGVAQIGRRSATLACAAAPFAWVALELARTHFPFIGFPWNLLGYSASNNPGLVQLTTLTGIYGLSFLVAGVNSLCAWASETQSRSRAMLAVAAAYVFAVSANLAGVKFLPNAVATRAATLVQPNFPQVPRFPPDWIEQNAANLDELQQLSTDAARRNRARAGRPEEPVLLVWPEVPAPFYFLDPRFSERAQKVVQEAGAHFLVGVVEWRAGAGGHLEPYNSAVLLEPNGLRSFQYDKMHLVPYGEYVPLRDRLTIFGKLIAEVGDFQPGREFSVGKLSPGTFATFICYEAVFPDLVRRFPARGAQLLVNISNDGWYGRSAAPEQHLHMARVRAVENRRWLLRGTNNGHTVSVDPYGRIIARIAPDRRDTLRAPYDFRSDTTLYTRWGDWWAWLCVAVSAGILVAGMIRRERSEATDSRVQEK
jgi:apolipoprotein N-acyltransferase